MKKFITALLTFSIAAGTAPLGFAKSATTELELLASEDFAEYGVSKNTNFRDYPASGESNVSGGTGLSGRWRPDAAVDSAFTGAWPKLSATNGGSAYGSATTGNIYRDLQEAIPTDESGSYYISFEMSVKGSPAGITGFSFMDSKYVIGIDVSGGKTYAAVSTENVTDYSDIEIAEDNTVYTYFAKLDINADGDDTISLKVYEGSQAPEEPETFDKTIVTELGDGGIKNVGLAFATTPAYVNKFSVHKVNPVNPEELYSTLEQKMGEWLLAVDNLDDVKYISLSEEIIPIIDYLEEIEFDISAVEGLELFKTLAYVDVNVKASVPFDVSENFNAGIYSDKNGTVDTNPNVMTGPNTGFELNAFKALDGWKKNWADIKDGFNIFRLGGVNYSMKVVENINSSPAGTYCAWRTTDSGVISKNVDVENGRYESINFLANTDTLWYGPGNNTGYLGVVLNYEDGTSSFEQQSVYMGSSDRSAYGNQIASDKIDNTRKVDGTLYVHEMSFKTDPSKILDSVDILHSFALIDDEGELYYDNSEEWQTYRATIYAMSGVKDCRIQIMEDYNKFRSLSDRMPSTITPSNYETCEEIESILTELAELGVDVNSFDGVPEFLEQISYIPKFKKLSVDGDFDNVTITAEFSTPIANAEPALLKGTEAVTDFTTAIEGNKLILTMKNDYDYSALYTISLNAEISSVEKPNLILGETKTQTFNIPVVYNISKFELRDKKGNVMTSSKDFAHKVTHEILYGDFEVTNYTLDSVDNAVTVALYSPEGEMIFSASQSGTLAKGEKLGWDNVAISTGIETLQGCRLVMYIWDSFGNMNSIFKDAELNFN